MPSKLLIIFIFFESLGAQLILQVTNTNDGGPGSLRQAILDANAAKNTPLEPPVEIILDAIQEAAAPDPARIDMGSTLTIRRAMLIKASPNFSKVHLQLSPAAETRHFEISGINVFGPIVFSNLKMSGGNIKSAPFEGGAIRFSTPNLIQNDFPIRLSLESCEFVDNEVGVDFGVTNTGRGGAVFVSRPLLSKTRPVLNILDCEFRRNAVVGFVSKGEGQQRLAEGSAIYFQGGSLVVDRSRFLENVALSENLYGGGAIFMMGSGVNAFYNTEIRRSVFKGNIGENGGSAVVARPELALESQGSLSIDGSLFHENGDERSHATVLFFGEAGAFSEGSITNSTFVKNVAASCAAAKIRADYTTFSFVHNTVIGNRVSNTGLGAFASFGPGTGEVKLSRSVIADTVLLTDENIKRVDVSDASGGLASDGYNFIGIASSGATWLTPTDQAGNEWEPFVPELANLGDYGGPTMTCPPLPTGRLVDAFLGSANVLATDARGTTRPQGGGDIGAVELPRVPFNSWNLQIPEVGFRALTNDPDRDGMDNRLEYYLGTDPNLPTASPIRIVEDPGGAFIEFARSSSIRPVLFSRERVEFSPSMNPGSWELLEAKPEVFPEVEGTIERLIFRYPIEIAPQGRGFYRIEAR